MKFLIFLTLFITSNISAQSQNQVMVQDSLKAVIISLRVDLKKSHETLNIFEDKLSQSTNTISNLNSLMDGFGTLYTVITVIFAFIGILIPVITYFYSIKPSREILKTFETKVDERLNDYLVKKREDEVTTAIVNLQSDNAQIRNNAVTYLQVTSHEGFTDIQLFNIYRILRNEETEKTIKDQLAFLLSLRKNDFATEYFTFLLKKKEKFMEWLPARYFGLIGINKYLPLFADSLKANEDGRRYALTSIISHLKLVSLDSVVSLLNSEEIVATFTTEDLEYFKDNLNSSFEKDFELPKVMNTTLFLKLKSL